MEWLLITGYWDDLGYWIDEEIWRDTPSSVIDPGPDDIGPAPNKPNIQLFRYFDKFSYSMYDVVNEVNEQQQSQYWSLKDTFPTSRHFGEFLWDNQLMDLAAFFSRRYWSTNYEAIIKAMGQAGTYEAIITVVESAMGAGYITFENPAPSHLIVRITPEVVNHNWVDETGDNVQALDGTNLDDVIFADSASPLSFQETVKLIELLNVNGVFIEILTA